MTRCVHHIKLRHETWGFAALSCLLQHGSILRGYSSSALGLIEGVPHLTM